MAVSNASVQVNGVRIQGLRDTALSLGARGGLAEQAEISNRMLLRNEAVLQRVFNFNAIMLDKNVLPPVLIEGRNTLDIAGPDAIRIADRNYQILEQARFVTAPPPGVSIYGCLSLRRNPRTEAYCQKPALKNPYGNSMFLKDGVPVFSKATSFF